MKLEFPHVILPQVLTHRMFSRNSSSSRAIPSTTLIARTEQNHHIPQWQRRQKGMQPAGPLDSELSERATMRVSQLLEFSLDVVRDLNDMQVAKEQANRYLEPFSHVQFLITSTDWRNFFDLRLHHAAQSEIQQLAAAMKQAMDGSEPVQLQAGDWHLPFVGCGYSTEYMTMTANFLAMSTARCARVSYWLHDGKLATLDKDVELHDSLKVSGHWSPFEHPAEALPDDRRCRNYRGWRQYRDVVDKQSWEG